MGEHHSNSIFQLLCLLISIHISILQASENLIEKVDVSKNEIKDDSVDDGSPTVRVVIGSEDGWRRGRVEEQQLLASANRYNYHVQMQTSDEIPCSSEDTSDQNYVIVFFPRSEGLLVVPPEKLKAAFEETSANIVLPEGNVNALIGFSSSIKSAAKLLGATSLSSLGFQLRRSSTARSKHGAKIDDSGRLFQVLDDSSNIGSDDLTLVVTEEHYELHTKGQASCIVLATPDSAHGRSVLLAASDYLTGAQHPERGCVSCITDENKELNLTHTVMIGVFITRPQPFLEEILSTILGNAIHDSMAKNIHFFVYNQIEEYKKSVKIFIERLEEHCDITNITNIHVSGISPNAAYFKNMALKECLRIGCKWYVNIDTYTLLNPGAIPNLLSVNHPVAAPALRVQRGIPATFWREIDSLTSNPAYSWDHTKILNETQDMKGYWHTSCIRGIYAIRHDVLEKLSDPYTYASDSKVDPKLSASDLSFCAALRDDGIPMVANNVFPNTGVLINITQDYKLEQNNLLQFESNPVMWIIAYGDQNFQNIMAGDFTLVKRPCHEVYEIALFNSLFAYDVLNLAKKVNKWSPALKKDPRKEFGIEPVPTVDQLLPQLGLYEVFESLYTNLLLRIQNLCFPAANPSNITPKSLIARFKPDELPGLPLHHDSALMTMYVNLTPKDEYEGGEIEFPLQDCRVKPELGQILFFPSRLTHPKVLHNVTEGVLYKAMIYIDDLPSEEESENDQHTSHKM